MARDRGPAGKQSSGRVGVDDWIRTGYAILAEEGITALKIDRLCDRLGVTKGSFYWHFDGMPTFRSALIDAWADLRDEGRLDFDDMDDLAPRDRLGAMMSSLVSPRHWRLERAMREWARSDDAVAASVRESDRRVVDAVRRAFLAYGFDEADADMRAHAMFAAGIGFLHLSGPVPGAGDAARGELFLQLLLTR